MSPMPGDLAVEQRYRKLEQERAPAHRAGQPEKVAAYVAMGFDLPPKPVPS